MAVIYTTKFYCDLCKKNIDVRVHGELDTRKIILDDEKGIQAEAQNLHWANYHRSCAICGKLAKSGELELLLNTKQVKIHKDYHGSHYKEDLPWGALLIVHKTCLEKLEKQTKNPRK